MRGLVSLVVLILGVQVQAQEPTELYDCVDDGDGLNFCSSDSTAILVDSGCGATFNRYHTRIAWPVLRNVGPVTISVQTRTIRPFGTTDLPLYVEVVGRTFENDDYRCRGLGGTVVLVAQGGPDCGGAWESVGPISLVRYGVPFGELYHIQLAFFESLPPPEIPFNSIGFSCVRVTAHPDAVAAINWSAAKSLYK